jgi:hypothetical protein
MTNPYTGDSDTANPQPSLAALAAGYTEPLPEIADSDRAVRQACRSLALTADPRHSCQKHIIACQIIGSDRCTYDSLVVKHNAPVLAMCRKLIEAGYDPERPLQAYRGDTLCLKVRTIAEGARLTVEEGPNGPRLVPFRPARTCVIASPMRPNETLAIPIAESV